MTRTSVLACKRPSTDKGRALLVYATCSGLPRMLLRVVGLRLREIALRVLQEGLLGFLVAEAISLARDRRIDRAIRLHVFAHSEPWVHMLSNSPLVAASVAVARPSTKAAARAELMYVLMLISCQWGVCGDPFRHNCTLVGSSVGDPGHVFVAVLIWLEGATRIRLSRSTDGRHSNGSNIVISGLQNARVF